MPRRDDDVLRIDADQIERLGPTPTRPHVERPQPERRPESSAPYPGPVPMPTAGDPRAPMPLGAPPDGAGGPAIPWKFLLGTLAGAAVTAGAAYLMRNLNDFTEAQQAPAKPSRSSRRRRRRRRNKRRAKRRNATHS